MAPDDAFALAATAAGAYFGSQIGRGAGTLVRTATTLGGAVFGNYLFHATLIDVERAVQDAPSDLMHTVGSEAKHVAGDLSKGQFDGRDALDIGLGGLGLAAVVKTVGTIGKAAATATRTVAGGVRAVWSRVQSANEGVVEDLGGEEALGAEGVEGVEGGLTLLEAAAGA